MDYTRDMKVTQTILPTLSDGTVFTMADAVDMKWYEGDSAASVIAAVAQIVAAADDKKFTKTVSITIEL